MKFTRLRLSGFKSFVDPIDLEILPGLTGVVGPNGCGKSNLLEALRWVMGETSYKSMRGSGMEDVIFSGTNSRPARNHAEVALYLDNTDRTAPSEYNGTDVIEVIRRIERDAGSAYRINSADVRARDVQLMFADASTGARSPALVKQGQIGELVNAKPENRRKILEEAAGISGLHTRRHEAELRLRGAENNLEKVDDMLAGLETQLRSLKRQARQAVRYKNLSGQIREVEALALHLRWQQAVTAAEDAAQALKQAEESVTALTGEVAGFQTQQLDAQNAVPPLRAAEAEAAAALHRLVVEREGLDREEARAHEAIERLTRELSTIDQDKEREEAVLADAGEQLRRLDTERDALDGDDNAQTQQAEQTAAQSVAQAETILAEAESGLDEANRHIAARAARVHQLETARASYVTRRQNMSSEITSLQEERDVLLAQRAAHTAPEMDADDMGGDALSDKLADAVRTEEAASAAAQTAQENLAQATQAVENLMEPLTRAQAAVAHLLGERAALAAMFDQPDGADWPKLIDGVQVEAGYETALGAALGDDLDASSDHDAPTHWRDLPPLDSSPPLPDGVRPLSDFVRAAPSLARRLSQIGVVEAMAGAALQARLQAGQRLVSLAGDIWRWDGYCAAAEAPTSATQRLAGRNRLKDMAQELAQAEAEAARLRQADEEARMAMREATEADRTRRAHLRTAQQNAAALRERLVESERSATKQNARLAAIEEACQRMTSTMQEMDTGLADIESNLEKLAAEENAAEGEENITERQEKVAQARSALATARAAQAGLVRERSERENRLARINEERDDWQSRLARARAQINTLDARKTAAHEEKASAEAIPDTLTDRRTGLIEQITQAEAARQTQADHLGEAETALAAADKVLKEKEAVLSAAREEKARLEATLEAARTREGDAGQHIRDTIRVEPEQALEVAGHDMNKEFPSPEDIEAKLERFRHERENLGGVNLRAEEEAEDITSQIDELSREKEDLTQAINKLRHGIGQLNREGRERLLKAFDTVNGHFKHLFTQLFGGGTANLEFTESDDPLQAGLEIVAHPPGKKPQVMSLLSGGEQALTAMSLIFAVFLTNPSPICVLDEVDAPLDDSNVERFCNMISDIAKTTHTRFLLITHHALTMARVDRLFGVTMQERGVSQLISVDLATAEKFAENNQPQKTGFEHSSQSVS